jgi:hypothetical protein
MLNVKRAVAENYKNLINSVYRQGGGIIVLQQPALF